MNLAWRRLPVLGGSDGGHGEVFSIAIGSEKAASISVPDQVVVVVEPADGDIF